MKQAHILLIEDTDSVREVLVRQLQALGAKVTAVADGERVKSLLNQHDFDLVIADLQLPDCSGIDIARFAHAKKCKVILLSGQGGLGSRIDIASAGFSEVLSKPIALAQLQDILVRFGLIENPAALQATSGPALDDTGVLHLDVLREQMGELDASALSMLARFPDMMRPLCAQIETHLVAGNYTALVEVAHSLKGAARSAGAMALGEICDRLQNGTITPETIRMMQDEFQRVEHAIMNLRSD